MVAISPFRRLLVATGVSSFGDGVRWIAMPLMATQLTDDPRLMLAAIRERYPSWHWLVDGEPDDISMVASGEWERRDLVATDALVRAAIAAVDLINVVVPSTAQELYLSALAKEVRPDCIIATGRSDYPNQVNNVLCFPYIFRGALDCGATKITEQMKLACVREIAALAKAEASDEVAAAYSGKELAFGPEYLIPTPFDVRLILRIFGIRVDEENVLSAREEAVSKPQDGFLVRPFPVGRIGNPSCGVRPASG